MKQSTKRLMSSVLALVFITSAFVIFFEFIQPAYRDAQQVRGEELSRRSFVENQRKVIGDVKALIASYQGEEAIQEVVSLVLPLSPQVGEAVTQLNGLAVSNNLVPQAFSLTGETVQNVARIAGGSAASQELVHPIGVVNIQTRLIGTYRDLKGFLENLETNIRIFDLKTLAIQLAGKPDQDLYSYELTVATYYQEQ